MKLYLPIAKVDAESRMVYGYASTEARDDQGEVVKRDALEGALGDYMKFGNIREMHQLSAVGKAKNAEIDDKGLYLGAKVVDDAAWEKVKEGVYNGFSIGGKVLKREAGDPKTITGLRLDEISLVDRPANPEAVFDCWKRGVEAGSTPLTADPIAALSAAIARLEVLAKSPAAARAGGGDEPGKPAPAKAGGDVAYADPGYQEDKKKRYPLDSEQHIRAAWKYIHKPKNAGKYSAEEVSHIKAKIVSAWKDKIDPKGPPQAEDSEKAARVELQKHLADTGFVADTILQLDRLKDMLVLESEIEGDPSPQAGRLENIVDELCGFLNAMVAEETAEVRSDGEAAMPADGIFASAIASSLRKSGFAGRAKIFDEFAKARHSAGDQALIDVAHHAVKAARAMPGLTKAESGHLDDCMECMKAAGARPGEGREGGGVDSTQNTADAHEHKAPQATPPAPQYRPGQYTTVNTAAHTKACPGLDPEAVMELIAAALGKRGKGHVALMSVAHHALHKMTDGAVCASEKAGGRHSQETMGHLKAAHEHICAAAGAECPGGGMMDAGEPGAEEDKQDAARTGDLQKRYDALAASVGELAPRLDAIAKTVEQIKNTPLPALTARPISGLARVEKGADAAEPSDDELMARIAKMSPDEQAMLLIKAARLKPILGRGPSPLSAARGE